MQVSRWRAGFRNLMVAVLQRGKGEADRGERVYNSI